METTTNSHSLKMKHNPEKKRLKIVSFCLTICRNGEMRIDKDYVSEVLILQFTTNPDFIRAN